MSSENNKQRAFPTNTPFTNPEDRGKTLRDWFAGQAMAAMLTIGNLYDTCSEGQIAKGAYEQADAMMEARKK
jgi:hypothetical protein